MRPPRNQASVHSTVGGIPGSKSPSNDLQAAHPPSLQRERGLWSSLEPELTARFLFTSLLGEPFTHPDHALVSLAGTLLAVRSPALEILNLEAYQPPKLVCGWE